MHEVEAFDRGRERAPHRRRPVQTAHSVRRKIGDVDVVQVDDGQLSVATFVRYDRPIAALVWPPLSAGHRLAMPGLLRKTVRAMRIAVERGT